MIEAAADDPIISAKLDNLSGDGFAFDHLVYVAASPPLVSHWTFDESSGSIAHDRANAFDGTLAGAAGFVSGGISGNALSLDEATGDYVNMGAAFPGFTSGDFSIVAWVKTTVTDRAIVASKHASGILAGYIFGVNKFAFDYGEVGKASFYVTAQSGQEVNSTTTVNDGQWHQIAGVYTAGGNVEIYVDGAPAESTKASPVNNAIGAPFLVGAFELAGSPAADYTGLIDDVQVYSGALAADQVQCLFEHPGTSLDGPFVTPLAGFLAPKKVKVKLDALDPTQSKLTAKGTLDTGPDDVDLGVAATITVGGYSASDTAPQSNAADTKFTFEERGLTLVVKRPKSGSSRATFTLKIEDDIAADLDLNGSLASLFGNGTLAAASDVALAAGKYQLGKSAGALATPSFFPTKLRAKLKGAGKDSFTFVGALATGGIMPPAAPDVSLRIGDEFVGFVPSESFVLQGLRWVATGPKGGLTKLVLDYEKDQITAKAKGVTLGTIPSGPNSLAIELILDNDGHGVVVRAVKSDKSLKY
jgi:Concanavalin A-like lectin/glucanases superfamily